MSEIAIVSRSSMTRVVTKKSSQILKILSRWDPHHNGIWNQLPSRKVMTCTAFSMAFAESQLSSDHGLQRFCTSNGHDIDY